MSGRLRVVVATANPDKLAEIESIVGDELELVPRPADIPEVVEDADTLVGNARLKAAAIAAATGLPAVGDDTGLEVDALGGAPGVHSSRYAAPDATYEDNVAKLLAALGDVDPPSRTARFRTAVVLRWPDGDEIVVEGAVEGTILAERRGDGGFGYDPVFVPTEGDGRTFAEMSHGAKHGISHRGRAFRALLATI
ncbi:MAG: RdgB/HAM1 family non-canonical purine NTP pyrophosphatase [Acidimicrobiia bacterium]|nr:RdgB/HAM1 family non-canonical purine NTP pyrophosphatase [Acidimicrobiia bacterium]